MTRLVLVTCGLMLVLAAPATAVPPGSWTGTWDGTDAGGQPARFEVTGSDSSLQQLTYCRDTGDPNGVKATGHVTSADRSVSEWEYTGKPGCPGYGGTFTATMSDDCLTVTNRGVTQNGTRFENGWTRVSAAPAGCGGGFKCPEGTRAARVTKVTGDAAVERGGRLVDLHEDDEVCVGAQLHTDFDSKLFLDFGDGFNLRIGSGSSVRIDEFLNTDTRIKAAMLLRAGEMEADVRPQRVAGTDLSVKTPNATAGVKGTVFTVAYDAVAKRTTVITESGSVEVDPKGRGATTTVGAKKAVDVTPKGVKAVPVKTATARAKARDRVLARIAKARACKLTVKSVTVVASRKGWKVTVKTSKGKSVWRAAGSVRPRNKVARTIAANCR